MVVLDASKNTNTLKSNERGASLVEMGLLISLVLVLALASIDWIGHLVQGLMAPAGAIDCVSIISVNTHDRVWRAICVEKNGQHTDTGVDWDCARDYASSQKNFCRLCKANADLMKSGDCRDYCSSTTQIGDGC